MAEKQPPGPPPGLDMQVTDVAVIIRAAPPDIAKVPTGDLLHELAVRTTNLRQAVDATLLVWLKANEIERIVGTSVCDGGTFEALATACDRAADLDDDELLRELRSMTEEFGDEKTEEGDSGET